MPLTLRHDTSVYKIPLKWEEVSLASYIRYGKLTDFTIENIIFALSGLDANLVDESQLYSVIVPAISFLTEPIELDTIPMPDEQKYALKLLELSYGQKEDALLALRTSNSFVEALPELLAIYLSPQPYDSDKAEEYKPLIESMPITTAYPIGKNYFEQLDNIEQMHRSRLKPTEYSRQEKQAGFQKLEEWGAYGIADALAGGNVLESSKVFSLPVSVVHTKIEWNNHVAFYRKRLHDIIEREQQTKTKTK